MSDLIRLILCAAMAGLVACGGGSLSADPSTSTTTDSESTTTQTTTGTSPSETTLVLVSSTTGVPSTTITTNSSETQTTSSPSPPDYDPALQSLVEAAIADLAQRLGVATSAIDVVSAEAVVWPDGALGCPQPGMVYTQVQVEGAQIILSHLGQAYAYHSGGGRQPFLCEKG